VAHIQNDVAGAKIGSTGLQAISNHLVCSGERRHVIRKRRVVLELCDLDRFRPFVDWHR
jgi:hypothetical protein